MSASGSPTAKVAPLRFSRSHHGVEHVAALPLRAISCRPLRLGWQLLPPHQVQQLPRTQGGQRGVEKPARRTKGSDDSLGVGGMGKIAVSTAGNQNFRTRPAVLLQQESRKAPRRRPLRRHKSRRPSADDHHFPFIHLVFICVIGGCEIRGILNIGIFWIFWIQGWGFLNMGIGFDQKGTALFGRTTLET